MPCRMRDVSTTVRFDLLPIRAVWHGRTIAELIAKSENFCNTEFSYELSLYGSRKDLERMLTPTVDLCCFVEHHANLGYLQG